MQKHSRLILQLRRLGSLSEGLPSCLDPLPSLASSEANRIAVKPTGPQSWLHGEAGGGRGFASKAEEYDIITVDSGLARIEGHDAGGFLINNAYLEGSVICTGNLTALWSVNSLAAVTADSLALLLLMRPPPDLLVLGCGPRIQPPPTGLQEWLASQGVALECLDTGNAVSTFNILNQEGRTVVAALLPSP